MKNILAIVGPTAIGKTRLAREIQKRLRTGQVACLYKDCELISVDSRQVYIGMDIGTGKDAKIFGTDLTHPDKLFNVADYCRIVKPHIETLWQQNKLPILVGGTGLYLKALIDGIETMNIPPNASLRKKLGKLTVKELQNKLLSMYGYVYDDIEKGRETVSMNNSDWNNPRRLIRKIEIEKYKALLNCSIVPLLKKPKIDKLAIFGLTAPLSTIKQNIARRVQKRLDKGLLAEIKGLIKAYGWNEVLRNTMAYKEWEDYFPGKISKDAAIANWTKDEFNYAKRQLTWFKKDQRVIWLEDDYFNAGSSLLDKILRTS